MYSDYRSTNYYIDTLNLYYVLMSNELVDESNDILV